MHFTLSAPKRPGLNSGEKDISCPASLVAETWYHAEGKQGTCHVVFHIWPEDGAIWKPMSVSPATQGVSVFHTEVKCPKQNWKKTKYCYKTIIHILKCPWVYFFGRAWEKKKKQQAKRKKISWVHSGNFRDSFPCSFRERYKALLCCCK